MAHRRAIYVDFDDVLCETAKGLIAIARREFGWTGSFLDLHSFDLGLSLGLEAEEVQMLMKCAHDPEIIMSFEPVSGAVQGMRVLQATGSEITVVTGRPVETQDASKAWLDRHGLGFVKLVFADKYRRARRYAGDGVLSLEELASTPFSVAIEDAPDAVAFLREKTHIPLILFDRPWNQNVVVDGLLLHRCGTWGDIIRRAVAILEAEGQPQGKDVW